MKRMRLMSSRPEPSIDVIPYHEYLYIEYLIDSNGPMGLRFRNRWNGRRALSVAINDKLKK